MKYLWHRITGEGMRISFAEIYTNTNSRLGIIPSNYISGVLREGKFAGHLIKSNTQIVLMEEWTSDSLSCEDAKRILQGKCVNTLIL